MKQVLLLLQSYLLGRTGSRVAGILLLLSLIWWAGPHVGFEDQNLRLGLMIGVLLIAFVLWSLRYLIIRRKAKNFSSDLQAQEESNTCRQIEIEELKRKMEEAVSSLKSSGLGVGYRGNAALYALPWFMLIGPSAAGKTTLLRNSGLNFPYAHKDDIDIKGFGGTRNCDWWFSDEAILLDTAGRYTTEEEDKEEWIAFLHLLRKHRSRVPVNGVLVAISLADVLTTDEGGIERHVKIIRDRLDELINHLGSVFPVYVVFTKTDLLKGFIPFFEDHSEHERNQIWGGWLECDSSQSLSSGFEQRLDEIYRRLCELRLRKLSMQRKFQSKNEIFGFPAEFKAASEKLYQFFSLLVKENPYQEKPRFSGVYFTSGTQEGTPVQRMIGNLRQAFGYAENVSTELPGKGKSFFIKNLFQEVIFPNSQGVARNRRREILHRWLKSAWMISSLALIVGTALLLSTSLTSNTLLASRGEQVVTTLSSAVLAGEVEQEKAFESLRDAYAHYLKLLQYEKRLPPHLLFGVYQGRTQISPLEATLSKSLEHVFFRPAMTSLEYRLENFDRQWKGSDDRSQEEIREEYYRALKTYLMMCQPKRLSLEFATPVMTGIWRDLVTQQSDIEKLDPAQLDEMQEMVHMFLSNIMSAAERDLSIASWKRRKDIVQKARQHLRTPPNAERLYAQILNKGKLSYKDLKLENMIGRNGAGILIADETIPGVYTANAWQEFIQPEIRKIVTSASRGDWVIGSYRSEDPGWGNDKKDKKGELQSDQLPGDTDAEEGALNTHLAERLEKEIRVLYFDDYVEEWFSFLTSIRYNSFSSLNDASKKLMLISQSDGPVGELFRSVSRNISLQESTSPAGTPLPGISHSARIAEMEDAFRDLRKFSDAADKMTVSLLLNQYLLAISSVQNEIERLSASVDVQRESSLYAGKILTGAGGDLEIYKGWVTTSSMLNGIEPRTRAIGSALLIDAIRQAWSAVLYESERELEQSWRNTVYATYARKLYKRFPFFSAGSDASLADVSDFFRPDDGIFWSFVHQHLSPFLIAGQNEWAPKQWLGEGVRFRPAFLNALTHANNISASLFRRGTGELDLHFHLYPLPTRGLSEIQIEASGQEYRYRNEPQEWRKFTWPGNGENSGARVAGFLGDGKTSGQVEYDGAWGIFHLLQDARISTQEGNHYVSVWDLKSDGGLPITVQFRVKADRANNILKNNVLNGFRLIEKPFIN